MPKHASDGWTPESLLHRQAGSLATAGHETESGLWMVHHSAHPAWQSVPMTDRPQAAPGDLRRWPADPDQLVDTTRCPACFSQLSATRCAVCGLDLGVPAATELLAVGTRMHAEERERQAIITRMRAAQVV